MFGGYTCTTSLYDLGVTLALVMRVFSSWIFETFFPVTKICGLT